MAANNVEQYTGPVMFFTPPLEIREMIYNEVYGDERDIKVQDRSGFEYDEKIRKRRMRREFVSGRFPDSPFCSMLVNKQFLEEAGRIWMRTKKVQTLSPYDLVELSKGANAVEQYLMGSISSACFSRTGTYYADDMTRRFPNLTRLRFSLCTSVFESGLDNKTPSEDEYTDAEIAANLHMKELLQVRGIVSLKIDWVSHEEWLRCSLSDADQSREEGARIEQFKAQVESLIRDVICQPRSRGITSSAPATLQEAFALAQHKVKDVSKVVVSQGLSPKADVTALADDEVPEEDNQLLRTLLLHPGALSKWIKQAKGAKTELDHLRVISAVDA